jgi:Peptidase S24-like
VKRVIKPPNRKQPGRLKKTSGHTRNQNSSTRKCSKQWRLPAENLVPPRRNAASIGEIPDPYRMHAEALKSAQETRLELAAEVLHRFGEVRFLAQGASMIPSIYPGDLLTVSSKNAGDARCGEVVLLLTGGRFFVHRVVCKRPDRNRIVFVTRGDALSQEDPSIDASQLLGCVTNVLRNGKPVKLSSHLSPWMKFLRWIVRNSATSAKVLLAAHSVCRKICGQSRERATSPGEQLQESV